MRGNKKNNEAGPGSVAAGTIGQRFRLSVQVEAGLGIAVLLAVGLLTSLAPPKSVGATGGPLYVQQETADIKVALAISPVQLGDNTFEVGLNDRITGQPIANADEVRLSFVMSAMEMGSPFLDLKLTDPARGRYLAQTSILSMRGDWDLAIIIKRTGKDDVTIAPIKFQIR